LTKRSTYNDESRTDNSIAVRNTAVRLARPGPSAARLAAVCRRWVAGEVAEADYRQERRVIIAGIDGRHSVGRHVRRPLQRLFRVPGDAVRTGTLLLVMAVAIALWLVAMLDAAAVG
jgi:hypothetical protein